MLSLTAISKTYPGGVQALQDIHLEVSRGMFGLLGPNGAGKSSLMRTIATLQQPDCGSITFNGIDILQAKTVLREARQRHGSSRLARGGRPAAVQPGVGRVHVGPEGVAGAKGEGFES